MAGNVHGSHMKLFVLRDDLTAGEVRRRIRPEIQEQEQRDAPNLRRSQRKTQNAAEPEDEAETEGSEEEDERESSDSEREETATNELQEWQNPNQNKRKQQPRIVPPAILNPKNYERLQVD